MPLESRVDYLTLKTGQKFELPFAVLHRLRDEPAALDARRRGVPAAHSLQGVRREPDGRGVRGDLRALLPRARTCPTTRRSSKACSGTSLRPRGIPLRGCHPRDLIDQALALAEYLGEPRQLTPDLLEAACDVYFVEDAEPVPVYA